MNILLRMMDFSFCRAKSPSELNFCRSFDPVCQENPSQPWYKLPDPLNP